MDFSQLANPLNSLIEAHCKHLSLDFTLQLRAFRTTRSILQLIFTLNSQEQKALVGWDLPTKQLCTNGLADPEKIAEAFLFEMLEGEDPSRISSDQPGQIHWIFTVPHLEHPDSTTELTGWNHSGSTTTKFPLAD